MPTFKELATILQTREKLLELFRLSESRSAAESWGFFKRVQTAYERRKYVPPSTGGILADYSAQITAIYEEFHEQAEKIRTVADQVTRDVRSFHFEVSRLDIIANNISALHNEMVVSNEPQERAEQEGGSQDAMDIDASR